MGARAPGGERMSAIQQHRFRFPKLIGLPAPRGTTRRVVLPVLRLHAAARPIRRERVRYASDRSAASLCLMPKDWKYWPERVGIAE